MIDEKTALVVLDKNKDPNDMIAFLAERGIRSEVHDAYSSALTAFKASRYPYVFVSMDMEREDPLEIIDEIRLTERDLGLAPALVFVAGQYRQPLASELKKYNICGVIRSNKM